MNIWNVNSEGPQLRVISRRDHIFTIMVEFIADENVLVEWQELRPYNRYSLKNNELASWVAAFNKGDKVLLRFPFWKKFSVGDRVLIDTLKRHPNFPVKSTII